MGPLIFFLLILIEKNMSVGAGFAEKVSVSRKRTEENVHCRERVHFNPAPWFSQA